MGLLNEDKEKKDGVGEYHSKNSDGMSYAAIGRELGISKSQAYEEVQNALEKARRIAHAKGYTIEALLGEEPSADNDFVNKHLGAHRVNDKIY